MKIIQQVFILTMFLVLSSVLIVHAQNSLPNGNHAADINGARIFFNITGRGTPLILIHGYPLNGDLFVQQRTELSRRFTVITPDLRGFGRSVAPDDQATIDIYANDILVLMNLLNIQKAVIGGHSMGGITALDIYRIAPARVSGLLLIDTVATPPLIAEHYMWRGYGQQAIITGADSFLPLLLPIFFTAETRRNNPELLVEISNEIRASSLNGLVGGANALAIRPDYRGILPNISVPTILIYGMQDSLTPVEMGTMMKTAIPNSEIFVIDGAAHAAIREKGTVIDSIILNWADHKLNN